MRSIIGIAALLTLACGSTSEDGGRAVFVPEGTPEGVEIGSIRQALYIDGWGGGYRLSGSSDATLAAVCSYSPGETCYFPGYMHSAPKTPYDRTLFDGTTGWDTAQAKGIAREVADNYWAPLTGYTFTPFSCGGGGPCADHDVIITADANIASPNDPPNVDQYWDQFVRYSCSNFTELDERVLNLDGTLGPHTDSFGRMRLCNRLDVRIDVGSFKSWRNKWATTSSQRQAAMNKLYVHIFATIVGAGNDIEADPDSTGSAKFARNNNTSPYYTQPQYCPASVNDSEQFRNPAVAAFSQTTPCD